MQKKVYVDTSALILLTNINELSILKLVYDSVYITIPILEEFKHKVPWWINLDEEKYINKIKPFLDKINLTNFRLSSDLQEKALLLARE